MSQTIINLSGTVGTFKNNVTLYKLLKDVYTRRVNIRLVSRKTVNQEVTLESTQISFVVRIRAEFLGQK